MLRSRMVHVLLVVSMSACSGDDAATVATSLTEPIVAENCAGLSMPVLGQKECAPVGATTVPPGFARSADGLGFHAIEPASECSESQIATLGSTSCAAVSDCDAPFPPAGTSIVVSAQPYPGFTVVSTLAEALSKAADGATVALDAGTYPATAVRRSSMHIVGRCASSVVFRASAGDSAGLDLQGKITVSGVRISGFQGGIVAKGAVPGETVVKLSNVILDANGLGLVAGYDANVSLLHSTVSNSTAAISAQTAAAVAVDTSEIRGVEVLVNAGDVATTVALVRVLANGRRGATKAMLQSIKGAHVSVNESSILTDAGDFATLGATPLAKPSDTPSELSFTASEFRQIATEKKGLSLIANDSTKVHVSGSSIWFRQQGAFGVGNGASLAIENSSIIGSDTPAAVRMAIDATRGAHVELSNTAIFGAQQFAIIGGGDGTSVALKHSLIRGVVARPRLAELIPEGDKSAANALVGVAVLTGDGAAFQLETSDVSETEGMGIRASAGAVLIGASIIEDGHTTTDGTAAEGIVLSDESTLDLSGSCIRRNRGAGLSFDASSGLVLDTFIGDNGVGLRTTGNVTVDEPSARPKERVPLRATLFNSLLARNVQRTSNAAPPSP